MCFHKWLLGLSKNHDLLGNDIRPPRDHNEARNACFLCRFEVLNLKIKNRFYHWKILKLNLKNLKNPKFLPVPLTRLLCLSLIHLPSHSPALSLSLTRSASLTHPLASYFSQAVTHPRNLLSRHAHRRPAHHRHRYHAVHVADQP